MAYAEPSPVDRAGVSEIFINQLFHFTPTFLLINNYKLFFWSYDNEKKCYILKDLVSEQIEPEGKFFAVWELRTDEKGRAIMPLMTQFMKDDVINFECRAEDITGKVSFNVAGKQQSGEVFYADVKFK